MKKEEIRVYDEKLGLDGTIPELVDWANRYDGDYSDEALDEISRLAREYGFENKYIQIPLLVKLHRHRVEEKPETIPYEQMKIDKMLGYKIGYSETRDGEEIEVREDFDNVLLVVQGMDEAGHFTASNAFTMDEFMAGEGDWLEEQYHRTLYYAKDYGEEEQEESTGDLPENPETFPLWARVGVSMRVTREEAEKILDGDGCEIIAKIFREGRAIMDGDSYIPAPAIDDLNEEMGTEYESDDYDIMCPYARIVIDESGEEENE